MITAIVIDDEKDVLEVFCEYLKVKNIRVLGKGRNGKDALELYQKLKPDVVLMDLVMPQYDGFYGIENIRKHYSDSKIIIFSASLTPEYVNKLRTMNVSGISVKPYDMDRIIDLIDKVHAGKIVDLTL